MKPGRFAQVLSDYSTLEPPGHDTWSPLRDPGELAYRLTFMAALGTTLRSQYMSVSDLCVLDIGCGNGRSTRAYIDFGFRPNQLNGFDLRPEAVERARELHPSIRFADSLDSLPTGFDWISCATVFSSITQRAERLELGAEITKLVRPGGFVFYYDRALANDFAGGDRIDVQGLFPDLRMLWSVRIRESRHLAHLAKLQYIAARGQTSVPVRTLRVARQTADGMRRRWRPGNLTVKRVALFRAPSNH